MGGTTKKQPRTKPARLTEFFSTASQSQEPKRALNYPSSPTPSSRAESVDMDAQDPPNHLQSVEQTIQKLFHSFRGNLLEDFRSMMTDLKSGIQSLVSRTEHIESKMADFAKSHNLLIDSHAALEEEVGRLSTKVLDLEDRSRRNNIRLRGIPESVPPEALNQFLTDMMSETLPTLKEQDLVIDRIHRIPKPRHLPAHLARDTIARIHFYHVKENFLKGLRSQPQLSDKFKVVSIFPDLSAATMLRRREFAPYTRLLRDNGISYKWGFPVKLIVFRDNNPVLFQDPASIKEALAAWNLISTPHSSPAQEKTQRPAMITPLWSEKTRRSRLPPPD